jgi:hypothetical protein
MRPSPALVIAVLALFVALGGTTYAVQRLPKRSVGPAQLRTDAVRNKNIKAGAVSRSKIRRKAVTADQVGTDALLGRNILESSLGKVPDSDKLDGQDSSKFVRGTRIDRFTLGSGQSQLFFSFGSVTLTASCQIGPPGDQAKVEITSGQAGNFDSNGSVSPLVPGQPRTFVSAGGFGGADGRVLTADGTEIPEMSLYAGVDTPGFAGRCVFGGVALGDF